MVIVERPNKTASLAQLLKQSRSRNDNLTILITGATSGIGLHSVKLLASINPYHRLILVGRTIGRADSAREEVLSCLHEHDAQVLREHFITLACDHCDLQTIPIFSRELRRRLDETYRREKWAFNKLDVVCLNAAVMVAKDSRPTFTRNDLEVTFQTNYLAPFLIGEHIQDLVTPRTGRIVFSTSGLHVYHKMCLEGMVDPESGECRTRFAMIDNSEFHFKQSYAMSKVCNVAYCIELHRRCRAKGITVNCFSPGLMTTSGLFRNQAHLGDPKSVVQRKRVLKMEKTVEWGAGAMVYMALADETGKKGCQFWRDADSMLQGNAVYGEHFTPSPLTDESISPQSRQLLLKLSHDLARLNQVLPERIRCGRNND